ncbi:DUF4397 domain-containing protein [Cryobacterium sp. MDB1-18-2]|uniref:DUF4397 domain-containing protein n=1 Tax=unclassified Cryobacterium TaxID=2649013 RepID=UPI00106B5161|nr:MULTISPECIES: DUF4397 domain-containing protein [unclassified Cryobacterium]TFB94406.1 DUF4397 domain-containing protein [Cryobacterium sp. MDB2-A-1]TFC08232.1 DUF4397 domain-containing protein [Cryobacterium sp. MDB2-A-2]TFC30629.1 DUF4397 domain-containing protein [Cryobacterium sp. MDB1-18-2]TFC41971.1 DUF4397 domain-containing protein [Cryobacterium sp. MDB1-18-1]
MRKTIAVGAVVGVLVALAGFMPANANESHSHGDNGPAELTVFHAIPGVTVDVYVNGALTLDNFTPGSFSDTLSLDPGTYSVAITAADAKDASNPVIGPIDLKLGSGNNYTAVAHLTEAGMPTATLFQNNPDPVGKGKGRLTVRHVAAAPSVDILANGAAAITDQTNPDEVELTLPTGTISAAVAATGTTAALIGPADVTIAKRTNTIVYAWGSLADHNLAFAVQTIKLDKAHH